MAKNKAETLFFCKNCGHESGKWLGQCPACHEWNTMTEAPKANATVDYQSFIEELLKEDLEDGN